MSSYGLWLSAAGMQVQDHRQALIANNMANSNTTGFKHEFAVITQRQVESRESATGMQFVHPVLDGMAGGLNVRASYRNFAQGPIERTGKPFDVAIDGKGFLMVSDGEATRYTRDGKFTVGATGDLVLAAGDGRWRVLDDSGTPITIDPTDEQAVISEDGTIRQGNTIVGRLGLVAASDEQALRKVGGNLFEAGDAEMVSIAGRFVPESTERSNVNVMHELVNMIEASRAYQLNSNMIRLQDEMTGRAVQTVGRLVS